MTKRFVVILKEDPTGLLHVPDEDDIRAALYYDSIKYENVYEVNETGKFANGDRRMTKRQLEKLWGLCGGYNVPFREKDYHFVTYNRDKLPWVEGWIGGEPGTLYVGVSPEGDSHS